MRRFLLAVVMCGMTAGAQAADLSDLPILRGGFTDGLTSTRVNWSGVYVGGQVSSRRRGHGLHEFQPGPAGQAPQQRRRRSAVQHLEMARAANGLTVSGTGYGGFVGYNLQWTDALLGVELNYTHGTLFGTSKGSQTRSFQFPTDYITTATISSSQFDAADRLRLASRPRRLCGRQLPALRICRRGDGTGGHQPQSRCHP